MSHHYFIGIEVNEDIGATLMHWQSIVKRTMEYKEWSTKEDLHLTLKFLGSCSDEKIEDFVKQLKKQEWPSPYKIAVGPAGAFGNPERPRVFHAEVEKAVSLLETKEKVERIGEELGFPREKRKYHPHITLAKKNAQGVSPLMTATEDSVLYDTYDLTVHEFAVFRIHPGKNPKYEKVSSIKGGRTS